MQTLVEPRAIFENSNTEDYTLEHIVPACNEDIALCGEDMTDEDWAPDWDNHPDHCVVCFDLKDLPRCRFCGRECWNE